MWDENLLPLYQTPRKSKVFYPNLLRPTNYLIEVEAFLGIKLGEPTKKPEKPRNYIGVGLNRFFPDRNTPPEIVFMSVPEPVDFMRAFRTIVAIDKIEIVHPETHQRLWRAMGRNENPLTNPQIKEEKEMLGFECYDWVMHQVPCGEEEPALLDFVLYFIQSARIRLNLPALEAEIKRSGLKITPELERRFLGG